MIKIEFGRNRRRAALLGGAVLSAALTGAGGMAPAVADTTTTAPGVITWYPEPEPDLPYPGEAES